MVKPPNLKPANKIINPDQIIPQNLDDYILRGWAYYACKQYAKALSDYQKAYESAPNDVEINYAMGLVYKADGQNDAALRHFRASLDNISAVTDQVRAHMLKRLIKGQINDIQTGDWNLEKELWHIER